MTPDELREEIARNQTRCRCGHLLAACADCNGWLVDHSPRIAAAWRWYINNLEHVPAGQDAADYAESDDRAYAVARGIIHP